MYACLHLAGPSPAYSVLDLALEFSPAVECKSPETATFCILPLRKLIGSPYQIASEISRRGHEHKLQANLAIASNPDAAIVLACNFSGMTLVTPGEERHKWASLPLEALFRHNPALDKALLEALHRWGLKTCGDLTDLPERGVVERLGQSGVYLRNLARGVIDRPLQITPDATSYEERLELEHPLVLLEPLLFLLSRVLHELCGKLRHQSRAARSLEAQLDLEGARHYHCELEFPFPVDDFRTMLKLLQLHLERHSPEAAVRAFRLRLDPVEPRRIQGGIFLPPTPAPDKLQVTLARIAGMVGQANVGVPMLLDTHRPDAFELRESLPVTKATSPSGQEPAQTEVFPLAIRLFRPALPARVRLVQQAPNNVIASGVKGRVIRSAGPWKISGEWWTSTFWTHEEWDVALDDGALYRIYQDAQDGSWFVHGVYD